MGHMTQTTSPPVAPVEPVEPVDPVEPVLPVEPANEDMCTDMCAILLNQYLQLNILMNF